MAFPAVALLDSFERAAENPLSNGAKWTKLAWAVNTGKVFNATFGWVATGGKVAESESEASGAFWGIKKFPEPAVSVRMFPESDKDYVALWSCTTGEGAKNGYRLKVVWGGSAGVFVVHLEKWVGGTRTTLSETTVEFTLSSHENTIGLTVSHGKVKAWFGNTTATLAVISEVADSTFTDGFVGIEGSKENNFGELGFSAGSSPVPLTGSVVSTSAFKGGLKPKLAGKVVSTSTFKGGLEPALKGTVTSASTFKGGLEPALAGKVAATSAFSATLHTHLKLEGTAQEENLVLNPSGRGGLTSYGTSGAHTAAGATLEARNGGGPPGIEQYTFVKCPATALTGIVIPLAGTFKKGVTYTGRVSVFGITAGKKTQVFMYGAGSVSAVKNFTSVGAWTTYEFTWTPTADETTAFIAVRNEEAVANEFGVSAEIVSEGLVLPAYFDGNSIGYSWSSTVGDSISESNGREPMVVTGTAHFTAGLEPRLAGVVTSTATFTGTLHSHLLLASSVTATSAFAGGLKSRLAGSVTSTATFSATLTTREQFAGTVTSTATFSGGLKPRLAGTITSTSTFSAALNTHEQLSGSVAGIAHFTGTLSVHQFLTGTVISTATFAGGLAPRLAGSVTATSTLSGTMHSHRLFSGLVSATSAFSGGLKPRLAGSVVSTAAFTGVFSSHTQLGGTVTCVSAFSGGLQPRLAGSLVTNATFAGTLLEPVRLTGVLTGVANFTGTLSVKQTLAGRIVTEVTFSGFLMLGLPPAEETVEHPSAITAGESAFGLAHKHRRTVGVAE
jgi:hypothetical protein